MAQKDSCNPLQQRDPRQSGWYRPSATEAKSLRAQPDSEPKATSERKRAAMAVGLDPASPNAASTPNVTSKDDGEKQRRRKIETTFGISLPEADQPQRSTIARAFGLRNTK